KNLRSFVSSLSTYIGDDKTPHLDEEQIRKLILILGSGQFFAQMLINKPTLAVAIPIEDPPFIEIDNNTMPDAVSRYRQSLRGDAEYANADMSTTIGQHRKAWHQEFLKIGIVDI